MPVDSIRIQDADYDLAGLETYAWTLLVQGAASGRDTFHTGTMGSLGQDNEVETRTMVLRQVDPARRLLASYSDVRAPKVVDLARHARVSWAFYDPRRRIELRAVGRMRMFTGPGDSLAEAIWAGLQGSAQHAFSGKQAMGTRLALRAPDAVNPTALEVASASAQNFGNFAVLLTQVERLEFLFLHHTGHHRARFLYNGDDLAESYWLST